MVIRREWEKRFTVMRRFIAARTLKPLEVRSVFCAALGTHCLHSIRFVLTTCSLPDTLGVEALYQCQIGHLIHTAQVNTWALGCTTHSNPNRSPHLALASTLHAFFIQQQTEMWAHPPADLIISIWECFWFGPFIVWPSGQIYLKAECALIEKQISRTRPQEETRQLQVSSQKTIIPVTSLALKGDRLYYSVRQKVEYHVSYGLHQGNLPRRTFQK